jgi:hypothetical protein
VRDTFVTWYGKERTVIVTFLQWDEVVPDEGVVGPRGGGPPGPHEDGSRVLRGPLGEAQHTNVSGVRSPAVGPIGSYRWRTDYPLISVNRLIKIDKI